MKSADVAPLWEQYEPLPAFVFVATPALLAMPWWLTAMWLGIFYVITRRAV